MMICTGHAIRQERKRLELPLKTLAHLSGISASTLCGYELGSGLLRDAVRERITEALERVERVRVVVLPAKLDFSDVTALKEAISAYESGAFASLTERVKQPENPPLIRF
jgi:transcriptional regulator with XRE-family HTH domain